MMRLGMLFKYLILFIYHQRLAKSGKEYDVIFEGLKKLGGIYIKLVQFVCLRTDIFPVDQKIRFVGFYDQVPYEEADLKEILKKEWSKDQFKYFKTMEIQPFAAGSFGQIYRAELNDGKSVVIKVKKNNLRLKIWLDFVILKIVSVFFNLFYYQRIIDVRSLLREFERLTYAELDYHLEAQNAAYFQQKYQGHPSIYIPKTFLDLCTRNVLVQEYVGGVSITDLIRMEARGSVGNSRQWLWRNYHTDIQTVLKSLAYELGLQAFLWDKFYADPHPGNIKILPDNKFALIDFGIVGTSPLDKRTYYKIVKLVMVRAMDMDVKNLGREFLEWGAGLFLRNIEVFDDHFSEGGVKLTDLVLDKYSQLLDSKREKIRQIEIVERENFMKVFWEVIKSGQVFNVKVPEGVLASIRTIAVYKAWNEFLEPDLHHMRETYQRILEEVDYDKLVDSETVKKKGVLVEEAIESIVNWVGKAAEFDWPFYRQINQSLGKIAYV